MIIICAPILVELNWNQFSNNNVSTNESGGMIENVQLFDMENEFSIQDVIADSIRVMFRFPHGVCDCLEPEFADAVRKTVECIGENRVLVIISVKNSKDIYFFKERTQLSCTVFSTLDPLSDIYDVMQNPYVCIVFPDMTIKNVASINKNEINKLIEDVKSILE